VTESLVPERLLRRAERLTLNVHALGSGAMTGEHRGRGHASSLEVSDHRAYAPGDDFRRVDWNAFARLGTLNVKLSEPQQNVMLHLLVDRSASMEFGPPTRMEVGSQTRTKARLALQIAACLAYLALTQLDGVRIYGVHGNHLARSPRYWGQGQTADALRRVQALEPGTDTDLDAALAAFLASRPERGLLVVLSDLLSPTEFKLRLRQVVAAGFEVALVHVLSELEVRPNLTGDVEIVDSETGQRRRIGATPEALLAYQHGVANWQATLAADCRALGARYVPLLAHQPIESVLFSDLRRYGLLE
jgi:uncharacterized protein (DUF58 family)